VRYDLAASVGWTSITIEALAAATALPELRSACNYAVQTAGRSGWLAMRVSVVRWREYAHGGRAHVAATVVLPVMVATVYEYV